MKPTRERRRIRVFVPQGVRVSRCDRPAAGVGPRVRELGWVLAAQFDGTHLLDRLPLLEAIEGDCIIDRHRKFFCG